PPLSYFKIIATLYLLLLTLHSIFIYLSSNPSLSLHPNGNNLPKCEITVLVSHWLAAFIKIKKSAIAPFSLLLVYSGAPIKYPVVRPLVLKKFFISLLLSDSILSISEFSGNAQTLQSIRRLIITRILSKALSSNSL